jgi:hypothetical protein
MLTGHERCGTRLIAIAPIGFVRAGLPQAFEQKPQREHERRG